MKARFFVGWKWLLAVGGASSLLMAFENPDRISGQVTNTTSAKPAQIAASPTDKPEDPASADRLDAALEVSPDKTPSTALPTALKVLSPGMDEIIKLAQGGVSETVLLSYISNSRQTYKPTVDEILFLTDLGVSDTVLSMLVRGNPPVPVTPTPGPAVVPAPIVAEAPAPVVTNAVPAEVPPVPDTQQVAFETQPVNVNYFYSSLSPYGSWIYVNGSGYCWQPTVCNTTPGWRPYANRGCWIYTDAGWYWKSDYSWGWAAFHYGRWDYHNQHGWVWCPGSAWAPSWVTWRSYGAYAGWAPLPSSVCYDSRVGLTYRGSRFGISVDVGLGSHHYTFVPTSRFCDRQLYQYCVPAHQTRSIYQNSTVINNYINGNNNTVINEGISRDQIATATKTEIRRVNIQSMATVAKDQARREVLDQNRNNLVVYRPQPVANPASNGAGQTSPGSTPTFTKHPPTDRRIMIPNSPGQTMTAENPIQKQPATGSFNPATGNGTAPIQSTRVTKLPPANRRIVIPTTTDPSPAARNSTPAPVAKTASSPQNPGVQQDPPRNTFLNQRSVDARVPGSRPSGATYANNFPSQPVQPSEQPTRSTSATPAVNPDFRQPTRALPSIPTQPQPPISVPVQPRTMPQISQPLRPVAPSAPSVPVQSVPVPVVPRVPNYTAPVTRPSQQTVPSQPAPAPSRTSPPSAPQSQPPSAPQSGGQNSSQGNQGGNPRSGGSDRGR